MGLLQCRSDLQYINCTLISFCLGWVVNLSCDLISLGWRLQAWVRGSFCHAIVSGADLVEYFLVVSEQVSQACPRILNMVLGREMLVVSRSEEKVGLWRGGAFVMCRLRSMQRVKHVKIAKVIM